VSGPDGSHDDLPPGDGGEVHTDGGVSAFTGEPFVTVHTGGSTGWQWSTDETRAFAVLLIRTAAAAEADADLLATMRDAGIDDGVIGGLVSAVRARRAARP
jgi:hypothetical protein